MSTDRYTAAHVYNYKIQGIIRYILFFGVAFGNCFLVQCVEDTDTRKFRDSGISCNRFHLIDNNRVNNVRRNSDLITDFAGKDASKVRCVLSLHTCF